jgi:hypothetical protein
MLKARRSVLAAGGTLASAAAFGTAAEDNKLSDNEISVPHSRI